MKTRDKRESQFAINQYYTRDHFLFSVHRELLSPAKSGGHNFMFYSSSSSRQQQQKGMLHGQHYSRIHFQMVNEESICAKGKGKGRAILHFYDMSHGHSIKSFFSSVCRSQHYKGSKTKLDEN